MVNNALVDKAQDALWMGDAPFHYLMCSLDMEAKRLLCHYADCQGAGHWLTRVEKHQGECVYSSESDEAVDNSHV